MDLCQRLFCSFQNSEPTQGDYASEIMHHVLTQLTVSMLLLCMPVSLHALALFGVASRLPKSLWGAVWAAVVDRHRSVSPVEEVFLKDVSCYFSLLEDGQPRDKLECESFGSFVPKLTWVITWRSTLTSPLSVVAFKLYDRDGNGVLDSSVSSVKLKIKGSVLVAEGLH